MPTKSGGAEIAYNGRGPRYSFEFVTEMSRQAEIAKLVRAARQVSLDLETEGFDPYRGRIRVLSLNIDGSVYVIDCFACGGICAEMCEALHNPRCVNRPPLILGQNLKFDSKWLKHHYGVVLWPIFDTFRASKLVYNGKRGRNGTEYRHDLVTLYARELGIRDVTAQMGGSNWGRDGALSESQKLYAAEDVTYLPRLYQKLRPKLDRYGLLAVALCEMQAVVPETEIELRGIFLDAERWMAVYEEKVLGAKERADGLRRKLPDPGGQLNLFPDDDYAYFNLRSNDLLQASLARMGVPLPDTKKATLAQAALHHPILLEVLSWRAYDKRVSSFGQKFLDAIHPVTGRVHASYYPFTGAGRYSCIPIGTRIATLRGILRAIDLVPGDVVHTYQGGSQVSAVTPTRKAEVFRYTLENGQRLECTAEHRVYSRGRWVEAGALKKGDTLYVSGKPLLGGAHRVGVDLAYLSGVLYGAGVYDARKSQWFVSIPRSALAYQSVVASACERVRVPFRKRARGLDILRPLDTQPLCDENGIPSGIPEAVWRLSSGERLSWLSGLYEAGCSRDGGVPVLRLETESLARDIGTMLSSFGILWSIRQESRKGRPTRYKVMILSGSLHNFHAWRMLGNRPDKARDIKPGDQSKVGVTLPFKTPDKKLYHLLHGGRWSDSAAQVHAWRVSRGKRRVSWDYLPTVAAALEESPPEKDTDQLAFLRWACEAQACEFAIKSIESLGEQDVLDITVPGADSFLVDGIQIHNCSHPNLQQIPKAKEYRRCFRAPDGRRLVGSDYSQVELKLITEFSEDPVLMTVYNKGYDVHRYTASLLMACAMEDVTDQARGYAKPVNFGLIYGMKPATLVLNAAASYGIHMTIAQAEAFYNAFFSNYGGVRAWHEKVKAFDMKRGYSRTRLGRIRYMQDTDYNAYFNCLDAKTEALTSRGWVPGMELREDDVLLTKNASTGLLEWQGVTEVKKWPDYEGPLVEFRSRSFNAVTTPNHRWLVYNKGTGRDECRETRNISVHGDHRIHRTGVYGETREVYSDDWVELAGWYLTDGTANGAGNRACLYQSQRGNPEKVARIDALLDRLGYACSRYYYGDRFNHCVTWRFPADVHDALVSAFPDRELTVDFMRALSRRQAGLLVEVMLLGDGWREECRKEGAGRARFCSGSERAAGLFQALLVLAGKSSSLHVRDFTGHRPQSARMKNVPRSGVSYVVGVHARDKAQVLAHQKREYVSREPIWCPIVPNTFFVARREGQVFVTGNTPIQGCLPDSARVLTSEGYRSIQDIRSSAPNKVWTGSRWASYAVMNRGECERAEVTLSDGTVIQCDTRHEMLKVTPAGYEWVSYGDLEAGDALAMPLCVVHTFDAPPSLPPIDRGDRSRLEASFPEGQEEAFWYWVGYYYGDGWKDSERGCLQYSFGSHAAEKAADCAAFWGQWGLNPRVIRATHTPAVKESTRYTVDIWSVDFCRWLSDLGVVDATASTKRVPGRVFRETVANRLSFTRGLMDSDGHVPDPTRNNPSLHLCQRPWLEDVKLLLRTLGVESVLRGPYRNGDGVSYRLDIFSRMWQEALGEGEGRLWPRIQMSAPEFLLEAVRGMDVPRSAFQTASAYTLYRRIRSGGSTCVYTLSRLCALMGWELPYPIYAYRTVTGKRSLGFEETTYTLSVDDPLHRFDAEGVIAKNTGADAVKLALWRVYHALEEYGDDAFLVHTVHDEIVVECADDPDLVKQVEQTVKVEMEAALSLFLTKVPAVADARNGADWGEAH